MKTIHLMTNSMTKRLILTKRLKTEMKRSMDSMTNEKRRLTVNYLTVMKPKIVMKLKMD